MDACNLGASRSEARTPNSPKKLCYAIGRVHHFSNRPSRRPQGSRVLWSPFFLQLAHSQLRAPSYKFLCPPLSLNIPPSKELRAPRSQLRTPRSELRVFIAPSVKLCDSATPRLAFERLRAHWPSSTRPSALSPQRSSHPVSTLTAKRSTLPISALTTHHSPLTTPQPSARPHVNSIQ